MNATANSGSMPDEQPAMIEMVPVGATVVRLQLRSLRMGRTRSPLGPRAQAASGPQIDRSHSGNTPRCSASFSDAALASSSTNSIIRVVGDAEAHKQVRPAHDAEEIGRAHV